MLASATIDVFRHNYNPAMQAGALQRVQGARIVVIR